MLFHIKILAIIFLLFPPIDVLPPLQGVRTLGTRSFSCLCRIGTGPSRERERAGHIKDLKPHKKSLWHLGYGVS